MTVPHRGLLRVVLGLLAVGLVLAGLSVEAYTRLETRRAQRALPGALARTALSDDAPREAAAALAEARRELGRGRLAGAAARLDDLSGIGPTPEIHDLAALAWMASDHGLVAARHRQLAARLAPGDGARAAAAERAVDLALAFRARPITRAVGAAGGLVLVLLWLGGWGARCARRRLERYLDEVSARVAFLVDGEPAGRAVRIDEATDTLIVDVFLSGRYGMACPRRPARAPTLHVSWSHAGANRTVRMRPVRRLCDSAVRIPVRRETLRQLLAVPGRWRVHLRLGSRPLATATVDVRAPVSSPLDLSVSRRNGALTA